MSFVPFDPDPGYKRNMAGDKWYHTKFGFYNWLTCAYTCINCVNSMSNQNRRKAAGNAVYLEECWGRQENGSVVQHKVYNDRH
jgi:hypothetical protein